MKIHIFIAICLAGMLAAGVGGCASTGGLRGGEGDVPGAIGSGGWFETDPLKEYLDATGTLTSVRGEAQAFVALPGESIRLSVSFDLSADSARIRYKGRYGLGSGEWIRRGDSLFHVREGEVMAASLDDMRRHPEEYDPVERLIAVSLFDAYRLPLAQLVYEEWRSAAGGGAGSVDYQFEDGSIMSFRSSPSIRISLEGSSIFTDGTELLLEGFMQPRTGSASSPGEAERVSAEERAGGYQGGASAVPYLPRKITLTHRAERVRLTLVHDSVTGYVR